MAYSQDLADVICARLAEGESLRSVCRDIGISHCQVMDWARDNEEFRNRYARAREIGDDADFEGLADIADAAPALTPTGAVDPGWVAQQKLRIDTRKWTLARKRPRKYGERTTIAGDPDAPLLQNLTDDQLAAKIAALQAKLSD